MSNLGTDINNLVSAINRLSIAIESRGGNHSRAEEWEVIEESPEAPAAPVPSQEDLFAGVAFNDYEAFADLLPACPDRFLGICSRLRGGQYSAEYRARRAWEAGVWAHLCRSGRVRVPRATLPIDLKPTVYIVVQSPRITEPTRVSRASDLARLTGRFSEATICHGFPSLAEAEVYCGGLGIALPCQHQFQ